MLELFAELSPTLRLGLILLVIVVLMRLKVHMGLALLAGALVLQVFFTVPMGDYFRTVAAGTINFETLYLMAIVAGLLAFSTALHETGQTTRIVDAFRAIVGHSRLSLITFPALIGFLPMPGGAIFSAPMVEEAARDAKLSPQRLTIANYWFRHIWEYWLPIYPGVMVAIIITGVPLGGFILREMPMTLVSLAVGYLIILRGIRLTGSDEHQRDISAAGAGRFIRELSPIIIVLSTVGVAIILDAVIARFQPEVALGEPDPAAVAVRKILLRQISILVAILFGAFWLVCRRDFTWAKAGSLLVTKKVLGMCGLVVGIMLFRAVLENCGAVNAMQTELEGYNVPLVAILCLMPLISGLVTGIAFGFVTTSFPIVVQLIAGYPVEQQLAYVFLAYASGYVGMMMSPVHLCLILTNDYFKSHFGRVYFYLAPLGLLALGCVFLLYWIY
jgi:uncharacterized protein